MSISPLIDTWYIDLFGFVFAFVYCTTSSVLSDTHVADLCVVVLRNVVPIWHQEALKVIKVSLTVSLNYIGIVFQLPPSVRLDVKLLCFLYRKRVHGN